MIGLLSRRSHSASSNRKYFFKNKIGVIEVDGSKMYPELKQLMASLNSSNLPLTIYLENGKFHKLPDNFDATRLIKFMNKFTEVPEKYKQ